MNVILLSGGSGKRLWPLSNDVRSKQFIKIFKKADGTYESMLQRVYRQIKQAAADANIVIATSKSQVAAIHNQLGEDVELSVEPSRKSTLPAIMLASAYLAEAMNISPDEPVVVCPVDTYAEDDFFQLLNKLFQAAKDNANTLSNSAKTEAAKFLSHAAKDNADELIMLGIKPTYPSSKYGYIVPENNGIGNAEDEPLGVAKFIENLTEPEAQKYIDNGAMWNSGAFAFQLGFALQQAQGMFGTNSYKALQEKYTVLSPLSFDHAIANSKISALTYRYTGQWKDLGTWNTLTEGMTESIIGKGTMDDTCSNVHILNEMDVPVLAMGLKDVVVAASPEGILVSEKHRSAHINPYVDGMEQQVRIAEKSWGRYQVLHIEKESLTILVTLKPGHYMSYHSHQHRDENWTVLSGYGHVIIDGKYRNIKAGDVISIKAGTKHTVFADTQLQLIENQIGKEINAADKVKYDYEPDTNCFGSLDIRGVYPTQVNEQLAYRIGRYYPGLIKAKKIVVGHDIRLSCSVLKKALIQGLTEAGCDVVDIGQCGTEMMYFTTFHQKLDGGIMITASHNPKNYNGFKFVTKEAVPVGAKNGLKDLEELCQAEPETPDNRVADPMGTVTTMGTVTIMDIYDDYVKHLLSYVDIVGLERSSNQNGRLRIVANTGNGAAGPLIDKLEKCLPFQFIKVFNTPDGHFPNGVPNPLLYENREVTSKAVRETGADVGIAWDGDFDRCFLFDENGNMVEGYYMVGLLAEAFLKKNPRAKIIHDPRVYWNTQDICKEYGGEAIISKSGHSNIKQKMRQVDAIYGGEMSAHHYFREFNYCDNGMIPWLLVVELLCSSGKKLSEMVEDRIHKYPISGEINTRLENKEDAESILDTIRDKYADGELDIIDGLGISFADWRFNIRKSNTEPLLRLNVESKGNYNLLKLKTKELMEYIRSDK